MHHLDDVEYSNLIDLGISGTGGVPIISLIDQLLNNGWSVELISLDSNLDDDQIVIASGKHFRVHFVKKNRNSSINMYRYEGQRILNVIDSLPAMAIHSHWPLYSLRLIKKYNDRTLISLHDHPLNCLYYLGLKHVFHFIASHYIYLKADNLAVVSTHIRKYASKFRKKPIHLIRNIINVHSYCAEEYNNSENFIVCIGNSGRLKNVESAIKAFESIPQKDFKLHLYGPGLEYNSNFYLKMQNRYDLTLICFKGVVSHKHLFLDICCSSGVIHPSKEEALPGPIIEAVLAMKPIVVGPVGDVPYLLDSGELGFMGDGSSLSLQRGLELIFSGRYINEYNLEQSMNKLKLKLDNKLIYEQLNKEYEYLGTKL